MNSTLCELALLTILNSWTTEIWIVCHPLLSELRSQMDLAIELLVLIY